MAANKPLAIMAVSLVVLLFAAGVVVELGPRATLVDLDVPLVPPAADAPLVVLSAPFTIATATVLSLELSRSAEPGYVGSRIALIEEATGETIELHLGTEVRESSESLREARARVDRVQPGTYTLRLEPRFSPPSEPGASPTPHVPHAHMRVIAGERSPLLFFVALAFLLAPLFFEGVRRARAPKLSVLTPA